MVKLCKSMESLSDPETVCEHLYCHDPVNRQPDPGLLTGSLCVCQTEVSGENLLFLLILSMMMIPSQIFLIPHYDIMVAWHLNNTLTALWLPKVFNIFALFMLRQFFSSLPLELDEAAMLDGCSRFRIYLQILLPLLKAPITALCILTGLGAWKDMMWPLIINVDMNKMVLSAGLANMVGQNITNYPELMAGGAIAAMPMILLFFFFQKSFVEGIAMTGTKA